MMSSKRRGSISAMPLAVGKSRRPSRVLIAVGECAAGALLLEHALVFAEGDGVQLGDFSVGERVRVRGARCA